MITDFTVKAADGADVPLDAYRGKILLIVNTASKCGYTPQYAGLEALHRDYGARGFAVLAFPCNQFARRNRAMRRRSPISVR
jgi:glutathione peroxidase